MAAPAKPNLVAIVNASMNSKHCPEINTITSAVRAGIGDEATSNCAMEPWNPPTLLALRCYHRFLPSAPLYSTVSARDPSRSHTFTVYIRSPRRLKPYLDKEDRVLHAFTFISFATAPTSVQLQESRVCSPCMHHCFSCPPPAPYRLLAMDDIARLGQSRCDYSVQNCVFVFVFAFPFAARTSVGE
jgi:hypothetical protein